METEQNLNITQTEAEALLEVITYFKAFTRTALEDWVGIELESVENKINETIEFKEE